MYSIGNRDIAWEARVLRCLVEKSLAFFLFVCLFVSAFFSFFDFFCLFFFCLFFPLNIRYKTSGGGGGEGVNFFFFPNKYFDLNGHT